MDSSEVPANVKEKIYDDLIAPAAKQIGSGIELCWWLCKHPVV